MRKLMIVAAILSVLAWPAMLTSLPSNTTTQFNPVQIAGDSGPGGG